MPREAAKIIREYGPFEGAGDVHGVSFDGENIWFASGDKLNAIDPGSGNAVRSIRADRSPPASTPLTHHAMASGSILPT